MKHNLFIFPLTALLLTGCVQEPPDASNLQSQEYAHIEPVGTVPQEFQKIMEENLFRDTVAFQD